MRLNGLPAAAGWCLGGIELATRQQAGRPKHAGGMLGCCPTPDTHQPLHLLPTQLNHLKRPMLERILHFSEVPVAAGTAACTGVGAPVPRWRSAWPLSGAEAAFVEGVLEHRKRRWVCWGGEVWGVLRMLQ